MSVDSFPIIVFLPFLLIDLVNYHLQISEDKKHEFEFSSSISKVPPPPPLLYTCLRSLG